MAFTSHFNVADTPIYHDGNPLPEAAPSGQGTGLMLPMSHSAEGGNYSGVATPFPASLLIPRSEWQARIEERQARKTRNRDLIDQAGLTCKDQNGTNFCWINAPTYCLECQRVRQNQEMAILSPGYAGGIIKNWRNVGGWGLEGLQQLSEFGTVPISMCPANAIDRKYATPENKALALKYRVLEWWELKPRNLDEQISYLLGVGEYASGRNRWSHETTDVDALWLDGAVAILGRNSWGMGWGDKGYFIMQGNQMMSDDSVGIAHAMAS